MNWIEKMIAEQCPNGVKKVKFHDFATYTRGVTYNKSQESFSEDDSYKILRANNITLERNAINFDDIKFVNKSVKIKEQQWLKQNDILICAGSGSKEHVGKVAFIDQNINYSFGGFMAVIRAFDGVNSRYLFHNLTSISFHDYLTSALNSTTINNLNIQVMSGFEIPLPSLSIQEEIVSVLDKFSELIEKTDEEIALRQKQYEYYREKLLTFEKGEVERVKLGEVIKNLRTGLNPRVHFKLNTTDAQFYYITVRELKGFDIKVDEKTDRINETARIRINERSKLQINDILFSGTGTIGRTAIVKEAPTNWNIKEGVYAITPDTKLINPYYFIYVLHSSEIEDQISNKAGGSTVKSIPMAELKKLEIPLPSLSIQEEIVSVLDKFETLISKLKEERELRQKQYEYYREKLLTF